MTTTPANTGETPTPTPLARAVERLGQDAFICENVRESVTYMGTDKDDLGKDIRLLLAELAALQRELGELRGKQQALEEYAFGMESALRGARASGTATELALAIAASAERGLMIADLRAQLAQQRAGAGGELNTRLVNAHNNLASLLIPLVSAEIVERATQPLKQLVLDTMSAAPLDRPALQGGEATCITGLGTVEEEQRGYDAALKMEDAGLISDARRRLRRAEFLAKHAPPAQPEKAKQPDLAHSDDSSGVPPSEGDVEVGATTSGLVSISVVASPARCSVRILPEQARRVRDNLNRVLAALSAHRPTKQSAAEGER